MKARYRRYANDTWEVEVEVRTGWLSRKKWKKLHARMHRETREIFNVLCYRPSSRFVIPRENVFYYCRFRTFDEAKLVYDRFKKQRAEHYDATTAIELIPETS